MAVSVTRAQADALRFIAGHIEAKGCAPTRVELGAGLGMTTKSGPQRLVDGLEERGAIARRRIGWTSVQRGIELIEPVPIPRAPDGAPLFFVRIEEAS